MDHVVHLANKSTRSPPPPSRATKANSQPTNTLCILRFAWRSILQTLSKLHCLHGIPSQKAMSVPNLYTLLSETPEHRTGMRFAPKEHTKTNSSRKGDKGKHSIPKPSLPPKASDRGHTVAPRVRDDSAAGCRCVDGANPVRVAHHGDSRGILAPSNDHCCQPHLPKGHGQIKA